MLPKQCVVVFLPADYNTHSQSNAPLFFTLWITILTAKAMRHCFQPVDNNTHSQSNAPLFFSLRITILTAKAMRHCFSPCGLQYSRPKQCAIVFLPVDYNTHSQSNAPLFFFLFGCSFLLIPPHPLNVVLVTHMPAARQKTRIVRRQCSWPDCWRNRTQEKSYPREIVPKLNGYDFSGEPWVRFLQRYRTLGTISPEI